MEAAIITAVIAGIPGLVAAILVFRSSGRATEVNARAAELTWIKELRQDALDTRKEMEILQRQVQDLRRQLTTATSMAEHWIGQYQTLHKTIWVNGINVDRLREYVGPPPLDPPPGSNGLHLPH